MRWSSRYSGRWRCKRLLAELVLVHCPLVARVHRSYTVHRSPLVLHMLLCSMLVRLIHNHPKASARARVAAAEALGRAKAVAAVVSALETAAAAELLGQAKVVAAELLAPGKAAAAEMLAQATVAVTAVSELVLNPFCCQCSVVYLGQLSSNR